MVQNEQTRTPLTHLHRGFGFGFGRGFASRTDVVADIRSASMTSSLADCIPAKAGDWMVIVVTRTASTALNVEHLIMTLSMGCAGRRPVA